MLTTALNFNGNAKEAMDFDASAFNIPQTDVAVWLGDNDTIAHGELTIHGNKLMLADVTEDNTHFSGFSLSINLRDVAELTQNFEALSKDAQILIPLAKTDWSACYGVLKDKFGVTWQFNLD